MSSPRVEPTVCKQTRWLCSTPPIEVPQSPKRHCTQFNPLVREEEKLQQVFQGVKVVLDGTLLHLMISAPEASAAAQPHFSRRNFTNFTSDGTKMSPKRGLVESKELAVPGMFSVCLERLTQPR